MFANPKRLFHTAPSKQLREIQVDSLFLISVRPEAHEVFFLTKGAHVGLGHSKKYFISERLIILSHRFAKKPKISWHLAKTSFGGPKETS